MCEMSSVQIKLSYSPGTYPLCWQIGTPYVFPVRWYQAAAAIVILYPFFAIVRIHCGDLCEMSSVQCRQSSAIVRIHCGDLCEMWSVQCRQSRLMIGKCTLYVCPIRWYQHHSAAIVILTPLFNIVGIPCGDICEMSSVQIIPLHLYQETFSL
jgi:hypothetical protein